MKSRRVRTVDRCLGLHLASSKGRESVRSADPTRLAVRHPPFINGERFDGLRNGVPENAIIKASASIMAIERLEIGPHCGPYETTGEL